MDPLIGRTLDNKYQIEKLLGKGGMGSVYMAVHTGTKRTVAVKVIAPQFMRNRELLIRFQREAEATGRLRHPNVVNVTDFGVTMIDTTAVAYLVMEYLDGETLFELLQKQPLLPPPLVIEILEQISLGVSEAHSQGILHRDLKPQNIWLQPDGRNSYIVKVLDFGIAKLADPSALMMELPDLESAPNDEPVSADENTTDENATQIIAMTGLGITSAFSESSGFTTTVGATLGTPAFMSPEQCSGRAVSEKSDLYSLAMMAYMMLAGELPFKGNARDLIDQQITLTPDAPHSKNPKLGEIVSRVILESLAKDPDYRAPNCQSFVTRMRAVVEGEISLLKESRAQGSGMSGVWFAILFMAIIPSAMLLTAFRFVVRAALERGLLADWQAFTIALLVHFLIAFFAMVWADMAMTRWLFFVRDEEPSVKGWFQQMFATWKLYPRALYASTFSLSPVRNALAHIVVLLENAAPAQARLRSQTLLHGSEHIALSLVARRLAISCLVASYLPLVFIIGQAPIQVIFREYLGRALGGPLSFASFCFLPIYGAFLVAWSMLYNRARRGVGEDSSAAFRRDAGATGFVGQRIRMGTRIWLALPLILLSALILPPYLGYNEIIGKNFGSAVQEGRLKDVEAYFAKGQDVTDGNGPGGPRNPVRQAAENGDIPMIQLLLRHGAKIEGSANMGGPLHQAVLRHHPEMVAFLLQNGAKTETYDNTHDSPLSLAAKNGQLQSARTLLRHGADRNSKDSDGKTPLDHAREQGHSDIVMLLEAK